MKKIILTAFIILYSLLTFAQVDTLKLFKTGSVLKVEKEGFYEIVFNPGQTIYIPQDTTCTLYDNIRGYSAILNYNATKDSVGVLYAGKQAVLEYLNNNLSTPSILSDENGNSIKLEDNGGLPVNVQDQTTQPLDLFFSKQDGTETVLAENAFKDSSKIVVSDVSGFTVGERVLLLSDSLRFYEGTILSIDTDSLFLDTPLDNNFYINDDAVPLTIEMNVNGSVNRQIFKIRGELGTIDIPLEIDITRILIKIICSDPPAFDEFGDIVGGLTKGIVLRRANGATSNIFNAKTNGELANLMYDLTIYEQTGPLAVNGLAGRMTFAGQDKHGVAIRLGPDESLELIIQDDLSTLVSFRIIAQGHIVQD